MPKPKFEQRVYTIDDKTWVWNVRENVEGEPGRQASGHASTREMATSAANDAAAAWVRMDLWGEARATAQWEPVSV